MDVIYQRGRATAAEVQAGLPEPPSNSAVRALLAILVTKGHVKIEAVGSRNQYLPVQPRQQAARSAIQRLVRTFFGGSVRQAVAALLDEGDPCLSPADVTRLRAMIKEKQRGGK